MKIAALAGAAILLVITPAWGDDDISLNRMLTCQDSWFDWKESDPARLQAYGQHLRDGFLTHGNDAYVVPKASAMVLGFRLTQLFPDSVGMGVGTSATVAAKFDEAKLRLEKALGKKFGHCETSDGMRSCELPIADKRNVMLVAEDDPKAAPTLIGCYYFYEK